MRSPASRGVVREVAFCRQDGAFSVRIGMVFDVLNLANPNLPGPWLTLRTLQRAGQTFSSCRRSVRSARLRRCGFLPPASDLPARVAQEWHDRTSGDGGPIAESQLEPGKAGDE